MSHQTNITNRRGGNNLIKVSQKSRSGSKTTKEDHF